jgi:hypothetical protein
MALWLSIVPWLLRSLVLRRWLRVMLGALAGSGVAELGRARAGGRRVFPVAGSLLAPLWLLERGVCAWLALGQRLRFGGVRYGDSVIRVAANSRSVLRQRAVERLAEQAASADTSAEGSFATGVGTG